MYQVQKVMRGKQCTLEESELQAELDRLQMSLEEENRVNGVRCYKYFLHLSNALYMKYVKSHCSPSGDRAVGKETPCSITREGRVLDGKVSSTKSISCTWRDVDYK